jgi:endonuclease-3
MPLIRNVKYADDKARYVVSALRRIGAERPDFDLDFLARWPVPRALAWLEDLPGVGPKVSTATLNFSTLEMPVFVVDTHVIRIMRRFGLIGPNADIKAAYVAVMQATEGWSASDLCWLHVFMKYLGQIICRHGVTLCHQCPIRARCRAALG